MRSVPPQRSDCWDLFRNPNANLSHINSKATSTFELPKRQQCNRNLELMAEIKDLYAQLDRMREIRLARTGMIADATHATSLRRLCSCQSYPVLNTTLQVCRRRVVLDGGGWGKVEHPRRAYSHPGRRPRLNPICGRPRHHQARIPSVEDATTGDSVELAWQPGWRLDRLVKDRLLDALEAQYPAPQLCSSNYKARRV